MKTKKLAIPNPPMKVSPMKTGSRNSTPAPRLSEATFTRTRSSARNVSGNSVAVINRLAPAARTSTQNITRHPPSSISPLPANGASMGETLITSMIIAISRVACVPVCKSRITARGTTITTAAPSPCTNRANVSQPIVGASAHATEAIKNRPMPKNKGTRRPAGSAQGP